MSLKICVYGGQFGSEGKGSLAEHLILNDMMADNTASKLLVIGENSPNSGHTNTKGKTRSLPVSAWYADEVLLGPDSAIDPWMLLKEIEAIRVGRDKVNERGQRLPVLRVHAGAALITDESLMGEQHSELVASISSTASGGGWARTEKQRHRRVRDTIGHFTTTEWEVLDQRQYDAYLTEVQHWHWLFECSQGTMLDVNLGYYPFVTSRSTHPRVAIERNGLGWVNWQYAGVYRTYPIRTGGPSGPTAGRELTWGELRLSPEVTTVTKRVRRVFEFTGQDFLTCLKWVRPQIVAFTHLDYLNIDPRTNEGIDLFKNWLLPHLYSARHVLKASHYSHIPFLLSDTPGYFVPAGTILYNHDNE